ncbi:MAG: peptidylprolyl isomerase [Ignavibacteriae bacterium HGW-Ignavibacteriae-1]|jgi:FKBP-type peptidyl-prolyl cis-trans isomerase 2|nr:MAG: peptidylprolyl isomerase [Ignavibacteriae bacterium HGW-Ignavibacteriae-1]
MKIAQEGDRIVVHLIGMFDDGFIFDNTSNSSPYEFLLTDEELLPGLKENILGMRIGEKRNFSIEPEQAYGLHNPDFILLVDRKELVFDIEPEPGDIVELQLPSGELITVEVVQNQGDGVLIDANHPYVGKSLSFEVELVDIIEND